MHLLAVLLSTAFIQLAALFLAIVWMVRDQRDKVRPLLVMAVAANLFYGILLGKLMGAEGGLMPWKYDAILWHLDAALGMPTEALARSLQGAWRGPLTTVYQLMVPMMIGWFLVVRSSGRGGALVLAYVAELITGPVLYAIVPACGPLYAFKSNWLHAAPPTAELLRISGMPNAFPSLHIGTAFVLLLFAPGKWSRAIAVAFFSLTVFATIATGEHYLIDLLPGIAFGCFAAAAGLRRFRPALALLGVVLAWSLAVRFGYAWLIRHPAAVRTLAVVTLLAAAAAILRFWRLPAQEQHSAGDGEIYAGAPEQPTPVHIARP